MSCASIHNCTPIPIRNPIPIFPGPAPRCPLAGCPGPGLLVGLDQQMLSQPVLCLVRQFDRPLVHSGHSPEIARQNTRTPQARKPSSFGRQNQHGSSVHLPGGLPGESCWCCVPFASFSRFLLDPLLLEVADILPESP